MNKKYLLTGIGALVIAFGVYRFAQLTTPDVGVMEPPPARVEVQVMKPASVSSWAFAEGTAEALRKSFLNFEQSGKVVYIGEMADNSQVREGVRVFGPSEDVRKGQLLAQIDNRESVADVRSLEARLQSARERKKEAEAGRTRAENDLSQARSDYDRTSKIYQKGVVSREEFERANTDLKNAEAGLASAESSLQAAIAESKSIAADLNRSTVSLEKTSLFAPFDGVITSMNILEDNYYYPPAGATSSKEREVSSAIVVVDDSLYEVRLEVPELSFTGIEEGQTVYLAHDDQALYQAEKNGFTRGEFVKGTVWSVSPSISLQSRSLQVKVRTEGDASAIRDGMFVQAWIATAEKQNVLTLPWQTLSFRNGVPFVYVVTPENTVEMRWVDLGLQGLDSAEVLEGVYEGEKVVIRGQHLLTPGSKVEVLGAKQ
ncbi:efflux RND transporter periplasmic adaptor subunit [Endozoicomonas arenosclerae]|uniref:efflux RND transporter periplasmic adaptor subunit n=1 Tax=Endozoicomonas arenosclerae TaxID=1633495 RepID=UPI0007860C07|nr:efflux RND transporter periplasmic adaptor subunit [Endozoicomonas arenosclerae]